MGRYRQKIGITAARRSGSGFLLSDAQALHLRVFQPCPIEPAAGARGWPQCRMMWLTGRLVPDYKPSPISATTTALAFATFARNSSSCVARSGCSRRPSWPSMAASSRPSTAETATSRWQDRATSEADRTERGADAVTGHRHRQTAAGEEPSETVLADQSDLGKSWRSSKKKRETAGRRLKSLLLASPEKQISLTDPDCRSMATSGRGSGTRCCANWTWDQSSGRFRVALRVVSKTTRPCCRPRTSRDAATSTAVAISLWQALRNLPLFPLDLHRSNRLHGRPPGAFRVAATHGDLGKGRDGGKAATKGLMAHLAMAVLDGEFARGDAADITGYASRQARTVLNGLINQGYPISETSRSPVRLGFPASVVDRWFPRLYGGGQ